MKILVTGATGFIGAHVAAILLRTDHKIIVAGRKTPRLWIPMEKPPSHPIVQNIMHDITRPNVDHYDWLGSPDMLIHLAWEGLDDYNSLSHMEHYIMDHYRFLKNMIEGGLQHLIVAGTCAEYGLRHGAMKEDMRANPNTSYGIAKDTLRRSIEILKRQFDFDFKWLRLFYMHGKENSILSQLDAALDNDESVFNMSGGEEMRDYLPVKTVAMNIIDIAMQEEVYGIINCCSGEPVSIKDLVMEHLANQHKKIDLSFGYFPYSKTEPMAFWGDTVKLNRALEAYARQ